MRVYDILVVGDGIKIDSISDSQKGDQISTEPPIIGFSVACSAKANSEQQAIESVRDAIMEEWGPDGNYHELNSGMIPHLTFEMLGEKQSPFMPFKSFSRKGYVFYSQ